jgi:2-phosphoglycerate kinase
MNKIILIGGAPTVGKSFIAQKLSEELGIPWISTDDIREKVKSDNVQEKDKYPKLFYFHNAVAEEYLQNNSAEQIVVDQNLESHEIWSDIEKFILSNAENSAYIIEGVAILPELVQKSFGSNKNVKAIFILNNDAERIRKIVFERGLWDDADKYSDSVKEKEVEWVLAFNEWLRDEVEKYGFLTVGIESGVEKILKQLGNR